MSLCKSRWTLLFVTVFILEASTVVAQTPKAVRLFILSGQSNMVGLKENESFTPLVKKAFPNDDVIVVKHAINGQLIRMWVKDWKVPQGEQLAGQGRNGRTYDTLMSQVKEAIKGKPEPVSVTFVWMQGEADANHKGYGEIYLAALDNLLAQLQADVARKDIDFVLGRISDYGNDQPAERPGWNIIREAQVQFAKAAPDRRAWIDTDDQNGAQNGLHYTRDGYQQLGQRFAEKAIALIQSRK